MKLFSKIQAYNWEKFVDFSMDSGAWAEGEHTVSGVYPDTRDSQAIRRVVVHAGAYVTGGKRKSLQLFENRTKTH